MRLYQQKLWDAMEDLEVDGESIDLNKVGKLLGPLVRADVRLSDEVVVRVLIEHGIITTADLGRLTDPAWCSRQEDLWWTQQA